LGERSIDNRDPAAAATRRRRSRQEKREKGVKVGEEMWVLTCDRVSLMKQS